MSVQPEINGTAGCSTSARLTSIASYSGRKETAVYATDTKSGSVIRCEVFIDKITRIQIFHHSVKLDIGGLSTLQIRAFDDNGIIWKNYLFLNFLLYVTVCCEMCFEIDRSQGLLPQLIFFIDIYIFLLPSPSLFNELQ